MATATLTRPTTQRETLREFTANTGKLCVDRENGYIRDVKVCGLTSKNNRRYAEDALRRAVPLYEGAACYVDHSDKPGTSRSYRDKIGRLENVRFVAREGLRGDLYVNKSHAVAEQLFYDATHNPRNVGLSHDVEARTRRERDGSLIVEEVRRVASVDIVSNAATNCGLFEQAIPGRSTSGTTETDASARAKFRRSLGLPTESTPEQQRFRRSLGLPYVEHPQPTQFSARLAERTAAATLTTTPEQTSRAKFRRAMGLQPTAAGIGDSARRAFRRSLGLS